MVQNGDQEGKIWVNCSESESTEIRGGFRGREGSGRRPFKFYTTLHMFCIAELVKW